MESETPSNVFDRVLRHACTHLIEIGWDHPDADIVYVDTTYLRWWQQSRSEWESTHTRDREPLREAIAEYFRRRYDEDTAQALFIVWTFTLELRARETEYSEHRSPFWMSPQRRK